MRLFFAINKPDNSFCNRLLKASERDLAELCYLTDTRGTADITRLIIQLTQRPIAMAVNGYSSTGIDKSQQFACFWRNGPQWAMAYSFTRFLDHTQRRTVVDRTSLEE